MPGDLLRPIGSGYEIRHENVGTQSGTAYDRDGNVHGGMGIDWGDYDNDGLFDLVVTTFQSETTSLYRNEGEGLFVDLGIPTGIGTTTAPFVGFGTKFFDYDNDGWLDLIIANGHVQDNVNEIYSTSTYRQSAQLFRNPGVRPIFFQDVSADCGPDLVRAIVGRGLAIGDFDNDGRMDVLIVDSEGRPLLLRNETAQTGRWLGVSLEGTRSNRSGYGAVLTARIGDRTLVRQCQSAGSYLSASDPRVHFGLGTAEQVDELTIRWPGGQTEVHRNLPVDRYITLREGEPLVARGM
jgi:enediyne biosynthesis protein E4